MKLASHALVTLAAAMPAAAASDDPLVPERLEVRARLLDASGQPVDASGLAVTFRLWDSAAGGNELFAEAHVLEVGGGLLSASLGSIAPLSADLFETSGELYLGVTVGGDPEMTPRSRLATAPRAIRAGSATQADGVSGEDIHPATVSVGGGPVIDAAGVLSLIHI